MEYRGLFKRMINLACFSLAQDPSCTLSIFHVQRKGSVTVTVYVVYADTLLNQNLAKVEAVLLNGVMKRVAAKTIPFQTIDTSLAQFVINSF